MGRFETVQSAIGSWDPDGTSPVGAVGDRYQTRGDSVGGAARRTTGVVVWVMRIQRYAVRGVVVGGVCVARVSFHTLYER